MERIGWIDFLRGISMILILVFHTEVYYKEYDITPYYIYTSNAIILFYFISGYLFCRNNEFYLKKKLKSIVRSLLIPYFIFTILIAIPKVLLRQENIHLTNIVINIISGRDSWFIAALIVGEVFFGALLKKTRGKIVWLSIDAIACLIIYYVIPFNKHNYWQWQDALLAVFFLYSGYIFHRYRHLFHTISKPLYSSIFLLFLIFIKIYEYHIDLPMRNIAIDNIPLFLADAAIWLLFIISVIRYIPRCKLIEWTGTHCIVYYFLCGGVPLTVSLLLNKTGLPYNNYIYRYLMALIIVYTATTMFTWLIYRYIPFITGKRAKLMLLSFICCSFANAQTALPIIKLSGEFGYDYQEGSVTLVYPDGSVQDNLTAKIKWRGGTTNAENKHKRNYKIKFNNNYSFFGLRNDDSWILDSGQADAFRLRNRIATELWNDFATKPYYSDKEPEARSGVRGTVVEVYLNDEYMGIYSFTEAMDRKQMKLKKVEKNGTIRGALWKSESYGSSTMYEVPDTFDNKQPMMDVFEAKYPDLDDLDSLDYSTLWNAINFVVNSSNQEFVSHVTEYFDIPVILDYYLFVNVLNAIDNQGKNMYWAVYDQTKEKKLTLAVWDLDMTVGERFAAQFSEEFLSPEFNTGDGLNLITRLKELNVDSFNQKVRQRYSELRKNVFSPDSLISRYSAYYQLLKESGAAQREQERWSGDTDLFGDVIDYESEITYISNWIRRRIEYLDENVFNYSNAQSSIINPRFSTYNTKGLYNLNGQRLKDSVWMKKGIYIRNGKKVIL